jgi:hypothetical protein
VFSLLNCRVTSIHYYTQVSLAERENRKLKSALKIFDSFSQSKWDDDLSHLCVAFNTAIRESTKFIPDVCSWLVKLRLLLPPGGI